MFKIIKLNKVYPRFKQESFKTSSLINNAKNAGVLFTQASLHGIVIRKEADKLILAKFGYARTGSKQMCLVEESDSRNKALMKMFNLINIGERAGSGVPNIFNVWADEGWEKPIIEERFDPDRTVLTLPFVKKVAKKVTKKKKEKYEAILNAVQPDTWHKASEFENVAGVKES